MPCTGSSTTDDDNPFAGKLAVKIVSVADLLLAALLLSYYGYKRAVYDLRPESPIDRSNINSDPAKIFSTVIRDQYILIWISILIFHSMQFLMSLVLLSATYERDAEDALGKCQMWWCTAVMLFVVMGLEVALMAYMMLAHTGIQPVALSIFMAKFVFRLTAVVNVRKFMKNLKKAPPTSVHQKVYIRSKTLGPPPSNYIRY